MMGGEGRPGLDAGEIIDIIGGKNTSGGEDTSNQLASADFRLQLPFLKNTEIYGEWGGEDEAGFLPTKQAYILGIYIPRFTNKGRVDLRIEYANNHVSGFPDVWYNHRIYKTGYQYKGSIIGHHMGSDAEDIFVRSTSFITNDLKAGIDFDLEKRGKSNPFQKEHYQYGFDLSYDITALIEITGRYGFEKVKNYDFVAGVAESHHLFSAGFTVRF
jgi:hypothetical protein